MAKNINIHLKTTGGEQTKQQLNQVADGTRKVGSTADQAGTKAHKGMGKFSGAIKSLVGAAGIAAVIAVVGRLAKKVAEFFDTISAKADEAVDRIRGLRQGFDDLYEAMGAFDEQSRKRVTEQTLGLLQKTGTPKEIGLPIVNAYTRQFRSLIDAGQLTQEEYDVGLEAMLRYGDVHGKEATPDLITMMRGWGMVTPETQGELRRQIASGAAAVGLTDEQMIGALSRGMPTIKAMGWTPAYAVEAIATIAAGEAGRKRMSLPATALQAMMAPLEEKFGEYGLDPSLAEQPQELLMQLEKMMDAGKVRRLKAGLEKGTPPEYEDVEILTLLKDIYGIEASAGVYKLLTARNRQLAEALRVAASAEGAEAERAEWRDYETTQEARQATAEAKGDIVSLKAKSDEEYERDVRYIGKKRLDRLEREEPKRVWYRRKVLGVQPEAMKMYGAYRVWREGLTEKEIQAIVDEYEGPGSYLMFDAAERQAALVERWKEMSAQDRYEALTRVRVQPPPAEPPPMQRQPETVGPGPALQRSDGPPVSNHYDHRTMNFSIHNPVAGINKQDLGIEPPYLNA